MMTTINFSRHNFSVYLEFVDHNFYFTLRCEEIRQNKTILSLVFIHPVENEVILHGYVNIYGDIPN